MSIENAENRRNALKISLFGKTSKQLLRIFDPENLENINNFEGWA